MVILLKINSQSKIIEQTPLNDFAIIENARNLSTQYLIDYEQLPDNEDKYRDIYKISESLKKYAPTLQIFNQQKNKIELEKKAKNDAAINKIKELDDNFMNYSHFKYKLGLSVDDTRKEYPELALKYVKNKTQAGGYDEVVASNKNFRFYAKNDKVFGYVGEISSGKFEQGSFASEAIEFSKIQNKVDEIKNALVTEFNFSPSVEIHAANNRVSEQNNKSYTWIKNGKTIRLDIAYKEKLAMMSSFYHYTISIYSN